MRRGDGDEAGRRKIEDEGISRIRLGKGDGPVGPAVGPMEVRHGENAAVLGYLSVRKSGEDIEGVSPGCAYAQSVEKGAQGRRERPGRRGPGETLGSNGRVVTSAARQEEGATTSERLACRS